MITRKTGPRDIIDSYKPYAVGDISYMTTFADDCVFLSRQNAEIPPQITAIDNKGGVTGQEMIPHNSRHLFLRSLLEFANKQ